MSLSVDVRAKRGQFTLDAGFEATGRLTALFGASGSGKTTLVNLIAGLLGPDEGRIVAGGRVLVDTSQRLFLPRHRRRIGYVFQDARLFPHLSVRQNLGYGRFFTPRDGRYADIAAIVELLGIGHLMERRPAGLSGGERQRVAIGRALAASPRLLLMDEPLASLDDARKAEILPHIERLRDEAGIPIVYVSHSLAEVSRLATDVVVMASGRVIASGPAASVLSRLDVLPGEDRDEAGSLIEMRVERHDEEDGLSVLSSRAGSWCIPLIEAQAGTAIRARIRARDVMIATQPPAAISALNVQPGVVVDVIPGEGSEAAVTVDCSGDRIVARITRRSVNALELAPGRIVHVVVKAITFEKGAAAHRAPAVSRG
ncbi:MAG: molybdenum ABC transporter ATP-binding protein [Rhizobiaceae bacterium]